MFKMFDGMTEFEDRQGDTLLFSQFKAPCYLIVWKIIRDSGGQGEGYCKGLHVKHVDEEALKYLGVWSKLSKKIQSEVQDFERIEAAKKEAEREAMREQMGKARKARRQKYPDIPKELTCTKCGEVVEQAPSATAATMRRKGLLLNEFLKTYECRTCNPPVRGRQIDPKYAHLPKEIEVVCSKDCGYKRTVARSNVIAAAKKKGLEVEKYLKTYECQKCNPTKRKRKAPKTNEENPYKIQCSVCKDWKGTNPDQVAHLAKVKRWTEEKVYQKYVCKSCDAKLPPSKKFRKRKKKT
jgi:hypothetical protein